MNSVMHDPETSITAGDSKVTPAGPTVLIVDDNESVTRALAHLFTRNGFTPAAFNTAMGALSYVHDHTPAAAVVDIHLPDLSGLVLSQRVAKQYARQGASPLV